MPELNIKHVKLFKFIDGSRQVNIYVEPTAMNQGRLIISTPHKIFQRFFDGAGKGIYPFLRKMNLDAISCVFDDEEETYKYLKKNLADVWPIFLESIETYK